MSIMMDFAAAALLARTADAQRASAGRLDGPSAQSRPSWLRRGAARLVTGRRNGRRETRPSASRSACSPA
ncbi:hypothetical protein [Cryptosporangium sp. NPDC051539]|uniref:hypothetical protein n=1 Tax=Cryptosporangium sp. NPDC051539 TaxID=3363962 RepID=UPI00379C038C